MESDKVSRLHARLSHAAQVAAANAAAPSSVPSAAVQPAAAKPSSPDDDAIVAALTDQGLLYVEPQTGRTITLDAIEVKSIYLCKW